MATQEDRSLSGAVSIPRWMKSRITDKFDFEQSAFSPTDTDDTFMYYYRHPAKERRGSENNNQILATNLTDSNITVTTTAAASSKKPTDFSKHPPQCQKYLQNEENQIITKTVDGKIKSNGTDDGFKGEAAKCGSSLIRVAHQMVSSKVFRGFDLPDVDEDCDPDLKSFDPHKRRGSRSLPASPLGSPNTSPKSKRRVNKYFTGAYTDADKSKGSWILSNLLAKRSLSQSVGFIGEETKEELERSASTFSVDEVPSGKPKVFKAKPSELREMNFWSPTSM